MSWHKIAELPPPVGRPLMVKTAETDTPVIAFLSSEGVWHAGGALVQNASTMLAATPTAWCEPSGGDTL